MAIVKNIKETQKTAGFMGDKIIVLRSKYEL